MNPEDRKKLFSHLKSPQALLILLAYILLMAALAIIVPKFINRDWLQSTVQNYGSLGILAFIIAEYLYVVFIPLYNTVIHVAAGYIFGGWAGWLINFIATSAGLFTIIFLVKRYGRPLVEKFVSKNYLERYDSLVTNIGPITLFIIYVLPITPDDEVTYLLAAAPVKFYRYVLPVLLGNVTKSALSFIGDKGAGGIGLALGSRGVILIIGLIIIGWQEYLVRKRFNKI